VGPHVSSPSAGLTRLRDVIPVWRVELVVPGQDFAEEILVVVLVVILVCLLVERGVPGEAGGEGGELSLVHGPWCPPALAPHSQDVHDDANGPAVHRPPVPLPPHHLWSCKGQESGPAPGSPNPPALAPGVMGSRRNPAGPPGISPGVMGSSKDPAGASRISPGVTGVGGTHQEHPGSVLEVMGRDPPGALRISPRVMVRGRDPPGAPRISPGVMGAGETHQEHPGSAEGTRWKSPGAVHRVAGSIRDLLGPRQCGPPGKGALTHPGTRGCHRAP